MLRDEAIEEKVKEKEQGVLLQGLRELIDSNTENIKSLLNVRKREHSPSVHPSSHRPAKLTKLAKVSTWTKDMSLETLRQAINNLAADQ